MSAGNMERVLRLMADGRTNQQIADELAHAEGGEVGIFPTNERMHAEAAVDQGGGDVAPEEPGTAGEENDAHGHCPN